MVASKGPINTPLALVATAILTTLISPSSSLSEMPSSRLSTPHHLRFLVAHSHLSHVFGGDWFAKGAKSFARFFGTPFFLMAQSAIVCGLNR